MARRWWKSGRFGPGQEIKERGSTLRYESGWRTKMIINGFGALCTTVVTLIFAVTKFRDGAWIVLILIPLLVVGFSAIHRHYRRLARRLSLEDYAEPPRIARHRVILPISGVHQGTLAGLRYAMALSDDVTAVHVCLDPEEAERVQRKWDLWGKGVRLVILDSPYRLMIEPLLQYVEEIAAQAPAQRDDHDRGAAVRAEALVAQRAARADRDLAAPGAALQAGDRGDGRAVSGGMTNADE